MSEYVKITQVKSAIGVNPKHRKTLRALGLRKTNATRRHLITPVTRGMIDQVRYLLKVEQG